jgi:hypothetical protein
MTIALILPGLTLRAQPPAAIQAGTIQGTLTDSSGAVIPGVTVSLSGAGIRKTAQSSDNGSYSFAGLTAGNYTLTVDYPGLERFEKRVAVKTGQTLQFPIQLRLRVSTQEVTVTGDRGPELTLDPDERAGATVVAGSDLDALPDNPDDLRDMLQLLAGPSPNGGVQILVDGFAGGDIPPKSAIKEIKINPDRYSADRDNWWSGIEITTKPGAEKFHGGAGFTDSDAIFNSRNPYAENKADYVNRMYTANAGDSIKNRASWTASFYQNTIDNTALIDAVTLDPATLAESPVRTTVVIPRSDVSGMGRLDYQLSTNNTLTGTWRYLRSDQDNNGVGQYSLPSRGFSSETTANEVHLRETATLSSSMVTDTRVGFTRNGLWQDGSTATPSLMVAGAFNGGSSQTGQTAHVTDFTELQSSTTVVHKAHTILFGARVHYNAIKDVSPSNFGGTFSFFGVTNAPVLGVDNQPIGNETTDISSLEQYRRTLLFENLGYPAALIRSLGGGASQFSIAAGNPLVKFSQTDVGLYINDEWRARPNLTVTFALRYENQTNIHDWHDFGPRLALAWSPKSKNGGAPKTVIRAGSGLFYFRVQPSLTQQVLRFNGTTEQQYVVSNPDFYPAIPALSSLAAGESLTTYRMDPRFQSLPEILSSVTVERQLPGKTNMSVMYLDQRTNHMPQSVNINAPLPGTYQAGQPVYPYGQATGNIFEWESGGIQKVKWLEIHVNSKVNQRISLSAQYEWIDAHNNGAWDNTTPSNPYNFNQDWGRASWTSGNSVNLIGTLTAPGGIEFSPIVIANGGHPYDLTIGADLNGDTIANDRPAFATDLSRPSVVVTPVGAFDTDPMPGQTIVPRNYLTALPMWIINMRVSKTFGFGSKETSSGSGKGPVQHRYGLNFNVQVNNVLNHLNPGGFVGNLSSPLFGQATAMNNGYSDTSNNRKVQFGTQFTF